MRDGAKLRRGVFHALKGRVKEFARSRLGRSQKEVSWRLEDVGPHIDQSGRMGHSQVRGINKNPREGLKKVNVRSGPFLRGRGREQCNHIMSELRPR